MWNIVVRGRSIKCICKYWNKGWDIFVFTVSDSMNATVTNCDATTVMRLGGVYFIIKMQVRQASVILLQLGSSNSQKG
jgi:hypothetical protein